MVFNHTSSPEFGEAEGYQRGTPAAVGSDAALSQPDETADK